MNGRRRRIAGIVFQACVARMPRMETLLPSRGRRRPRCSRAAETGGSRGVARRARTLKSNHTVVSKLNINEVAKLAFVSRSVVSRVLNGQPHVSDEARARVLRVIEEYDYRPNYAARMLATQRSREICMISPTEPKAVRANGFWSLLVSGVAEGCSARRYHLSIFSSAEQVSEEFFSSPALDVPFDGYIVFSKHIDREVIAYLRGRDFPVVLIEDHPDYPEASFVFVDNVVSACRAVRYLISLGHREIALIHGPEEAQVSHDRNEGYRLALKGAGLSCRSEHVVQSDFTEEGGYSAMQRLLGRRDRPTAVFCMSDGIATGALLALYEAGVQVPERMSVVSFGGYPRSAFTIPPLTAVQQPVFELGLKAAGVLIDQIEGDLAGGARHELPAPLVVRRSTAPPHESVGPERE